MCIGSSRIASHRLSVCFPVCTSRGIRLYLYTLSPSLSVSRCLSFSPSPVCLSIYRLYLCGCFPPRVVFSRPPSATHPPTCPTPFPPLVLAFLSIYMSICVGAVCLFSHLCQQSIRLSHSQLNVIMERHFHTTWIYITRVFTVREDSYLSTAGGWRSEGPGACPRCRCYLPPPPPRRCKRWRAWRGRHQFLLQPPRHPQVSDP